MSRATRLNANPAGIYVPQRAFMRFDPSGRSNGAIPSLADTGQALTPFVQSAGNPAPLSISGGVITHTPPGSGVNSACYLQCHLGARVHRIGALISWPTNAIGVAALVIPSAAWSDGTLPNAGFHLSINGNGIWTLTRFTTGGSTTLASYTTHGRWNTVWGTGLQPFDVWLDPDNSKAVIVWPDGTATTVTSAYLGSETGNYAIWELFENSGTDVAGSFGAIWADTQPVTADVSALTAYRALKLNPPGALNFSGGVTVDFSTSTTQVITLVGNATSLQLIGASNKAQLLHLELVQDGTGSRTLSGAVSAIKWAGGAAPTLSTTANRRDIFRFRWDGNNYLEVSRSMNVG